MDTILYHFKGNTYTGYIVTSKSEYPHYYWCFLEDAELINDLGDCITFQMQRGGDLEPTEFYPSKYESLITHIKELIAEYIENRQY